MTMFGGNQLGSPSYDTGMGVERARALLRDALADDADPSAVTGVIVFTGSRVKLQIDRCTYPATYGKELRKVVTRTKGRLTPPKIGQIRQVLDSLLARPAGS
jgi:hypothetical protein